MRRLSYALALAAVILTLTCVAACAPLGPPSTVYGDGGGVVHAYVLRAAASRSSARVLVLDGVCASACVVWFDRARPNACVTRQSTFRFHMMTTTWANGTTKVSDRTAHFHSPDIAAWVASRGGAPRDGWLDMTGAEAIDGGYWRECAGARRFPTLVRKRR